MANRSPSFKQADIMRAVKGAARGGMKVGTVTIDPSDGRIVVSVVGAIADPPLSPLDKWKAEQGAR